MSKGKHKEMEDKREKRFMPFAPSAGEVRATEDSDGQRYIEGYALKFGQRSQLLYDWFYEEIDPRALDNCDMTDVLSTLNHNFSNYLGRNASSSSLELEKRDDGLYYKVAVPDTPAGEEAYYLVNRGDVRGSSFIFTAKANKWEELDEGHELRTVLEIDRIYELGPVLNPAYLQTTADVAKRSMEEYYKQIEDDAPKPVKRMIAKRRLELLKRLK